jgi:hypothetical protein
MQTATLTTDTERAIRAAIRDDAGFGEWATVATHDATSSLAVQMRVTNARALCGSVGRRVDLRLVSRLGTRNGARLTTLAEWCAIASLADRGALYDAAANAAERMLSR